MRQSSCDSALGAALDGSGAFMSNFLHTCCPELHTSPPLVTLSGSIVIAQVSWGHGTNCTQIYGRFNLFEALYRSQVSTLFLDVVDVMHTSFLNGGQPVTMLAFCQPFTMFFTNCPTVPMFIGPVTIFVTNFINPSRCRR